MPDVHNAEQRSRNMASIRSTNTKPEMKLRRMIHARGYRYRLHVRELPGTPDLVFPGRRKVIFVNGCFWHLHSCRYGQVTPSTNSEFWQNKRAATVSRDSQKRSELHALGWQTHTVWECALRNPADAIDSVTRFLDS